MKKFQKKRLRRKVPLTKAEADSLSIASRANPLPGIGITRKQLERVEFLEKQKKKDIEDGKL